MTEASWFDRFTTRLGDTLIAPQQPWGALIPGMPPPTSEQRGQMIGNTLLNLGGALSHGARQRLPIGESLAAGMQAAQQGGALRSQQQMQGLLLGDRLRETERANATRAALKRKPPAGLSPDMIDLLAPGDIGRIWWAAQKGPDVRATARQPQAVAPGQVLMDKDGNRYRFDPADSQWKDARTGQPYAPGLPPAAPMPTR